MSSWLSKVTKKVTNAFKHPGKTVKNAIKDAGRDIGWTKWGPTALTVSGGAVLGALTGGLGAAGVAGLAGGAAAGGTIGTAAGIGAAGGALAGGMADQAHKAYKAQQAAADAEAAGYDKIAQAMKSQPTANASLAAGAALEQDVGSQLSEQAVQKANKRRRTLQSTVNKLGTSGGLGGRATLG